MIVWFFPRQFQRQNPDAADRPAPNKTQRGEGRIWSKLLMELDRASNTSAGTLITVGLGIMVWIIQEIVPPFGLVYETPKALKPFLEEGRYLLSPLHQGTPRARKDGCYVMAQQLKGRR
ncbi:hypothetical protein ASPZODRAFT_714333 [Penicilliopsis zonata CBS 506.65]|uniref:Uncharacterized protein n=1 Tax=Penicilliopsis zonata CBS 506.65 TaxID=1073090 RepID=A0A1L9SBV1_9EURO|nr:hypothetical protein ASPZODRAFT_714333 [Penicilliopsis zonata CBS 506.65]OJJ44685.1 hypothetical protein ASPZODRAFT_714333 [Penicilliopsis zonata CBS 506.65]